MKKNLWIVENFKLFIYCSVCHHRLTPYPIIQTRWPSHMWLLYYISKIWLGQSENTLNFEVLVKNCSVSIFCWNDDTVLCVCAVCLFARLHLTFCKLLGLQPARFLCPWDFPGKNIEMGCHFLLLEIFHTQGSNLRLLCFLHWRQILYLLSHQGSHDIVHIK